MTISSIREDVRKFSVKTEPRDNLEEEDDMAVVSILRFALLVISMRHSSYSEDGAVKTFDRSVAAALFPKTHL